MTQNKYPQRIEKSEIMYKMWKDGDGDIDELAIGLYNLTAEYKALWDEHFPKYVSPGQRLAEIREEESVRREYVYVATLRVHSEYLYDSHASAYKIGKRREDKFDVYEKELGRRYCDKGLAIFFAVAVPAQDAASLESEMHDKYITYNIRSRGATEYGKEIFSFPYDVLDDLLQTLRERGDVVRSIEQVRL